MALPVAHFSVAFGAQRSRDPLVWAFLAVVSVVPDFDLFLVWVMGLPMESAHRTWSHSILFALVMAFAWNRLKPKRFESISGSLFFVVFISHGLLDLLCTADAADHGVMLFWPLETRLGWPVLVPLYLQWADSPFHLAGALRFTALELLLAVPVWAAMRLLRRGVDLLGERWRLYRNELDFGDQRPESR